MCVILSSWATIFEGLKLIIHHKAGSANRARQFSTTLYGSSPLHTSTCLLLPKNCDYFHVTNQAQNRSRPGFRVLKKKSRKEALFLLQRCDTQLPPVWLGRHFLEIDLQFNSYLHMNTVQVHQHMVLSSNHDEMEWINGINDVLPLSQ